MGISGMMLLAVTVFGAILLAFSIFLFVKRKGAVGGPVLLVGVLAFGVGSFSLFASQNENPVAPSSASSEEKDSEDDSNQSASQEMEDVEANEDASESGGDSNVNPSGSSSASAKSYEEQTIADINELLVQAEQLYEALDVFYEDGGYDYSTYEQAHEEMLAFDDIIAKAYSYDSAPSEYSEFESDYKVFLDELVYLSDDLYTAVEDYYNDEDYYGNLASLLYEERSYLQEAADAVDVSAAEAFEHYDFIEELGGEGWEDSSYY